jgi:hypothetical protein
MPQRVADVEKDCADTHRPGSGSPIAGSHAPRVPTKRNPGPA